MAIFGLPEGDFIAILALCVAVVIPIVTLVATYSRNRKSEQIRMARENRDDINNKLDPYDKFLIENKYPYGGYYNLLKISVNG
jgi:hypothetical protein